MNRLILFFLAILTTAVNGSQTDKQVVQEILTLADVQIDGSRPWDIKVNDDRFYARVLRDTSLGLGESYMEGWWSAQDLEQLIYKLVRANLETRVKPSWSMFWNVLRAKLFNTQDKKGSLAVIDTHYQLGNDFFRAMLGETMAYSCAYWKSAANLDEAQRAKYDLIARKLGMQKGMRVLDIGCGWGSFAKHIAEHYGVSVVGITLSENQANYARELNKGLPVEIRVQDYRDIHEQFDRIVEIGMFEHVGYKNYRLFMESVHENLKEGGLFMLHTIGSNQTRLVTEPWTHKYIFPEGVLPSIAAIGKSIEGLFVMEDWHNLNVDYEKTLLAWFRNFDANWDKFKAQYPKPFYNMWKYYLLSSAGSFRARDIQLWQVVLSKGGVLNGYQSVR